MPAATAAALPPLEPTRGTGDVVGVAGGSVRVGLGHGDEPELRCVRSPEKAEAGPAIPADQPGVLFRPPAGVTEGAVAVVGRVPAESAKRSLMKKRHTVERPLGQTRLDLAECRLETPVDDGIERPVDGFDPRNGLGRELRRADLLGAHELGLRRRIHPQHVIHVPDAGRPLPARRWGQRGPGRLTLNVVVPRRDRGLAPRTRCRG